MILAAGLTATLRAPAGAVGAWSVMPSASPTSGAGILLADVACPGATSCFAVGTARNAPFVEHWDGTRWSTVAVPAPGDAYGVLQDISCPTTTSCFALGDGTSQSFFEHWNGTTWAIVPGLDSGPSLDSVACTSDSNCFAVGTTNSSTGAMVERWNGTTWSIVPGPVVDPDSASLEGVSCADPSSCVAVGFVYNGGNPRTLIEHWDGAAWSVDANPNPAGERPELRSVSCADETTCFAVGQFDSPEPVWPPFTRSLIERWNGTKWSIIASPNTDSKLGTPVNALRDVTCVGETNCFATRAIQSYDEVPHAAVDHWNGTSWTVSTTLTSDPNFNSLVGVACATASSCFAVGSVGENPEPGIILHWNGSTWSISDQRVTPAPPNAVLSGVACPTSATCFAVGHYTNAAGEISSLVERRTAGNWQVVASPNKIGGAESTLSAVACASTTMCFAVGTYADTTERIRTFILRWDGRSWSNMPSPNDSHSANSFANELSGVACATAKSCFAVGNYDNGSRKTLIEAWDGAKWTIVKSPNGNKILNNELLGVSCTTATNCFAVGQSSTDGGSRPMTVHWDGKTWTIIPSPDMPGRTFDSLAAVSCPSAKMCVAVGNVQTSTATTALALRWNGVAWSRMASSDPTGLRNALTGVACPSVTACLAVGTSTTTSGISRTLARALAGTKWSAAPAVTPSGAQNSVFNAVSCPSGAACFAAGDDDTAGGTHTLVERRDQA